MDASKFSIDKSVDEEWTFTVRTSSREELETYMNAYRYLSSIQEMLRSLRNSRKYSQNEAESEWAATFEQIFFDIIDSNEVGQW